MFWENLSVQVVYFFPLWIRSFLFFQFTPLIGASFVPVRLRVSMALLVAWWFTPILQARGVYGDINLTLWLLYVAGEALIGLIQAFIISSFYYTLQMASHFFSFQMGLTMAQISDPSSDLEMPVVGQLLTALGIWIFFSNDYLFHLFWLGLSESIERVNIFSLVRLGDSPFKDLLLGVLVEVFSKSLLLSLPIIGVLFLINVLSGLLGKAAPQINLLILVFPVCIAVGLYVLFMALPSLSHSFCAILEESFKTFASLLTYFSGDSA